MKGLTNFGTGKCLYSRTMMYCVRFEHLVLVYHGSLDFRHSSLVAPTALHAKAHTRTSPGKGLTGGGSTCGSGRCWALCGQ
jgi:hypothetical protein